ncbi:hypothetical protein [Sphingomonas cavernae]|nr:hypothetical protein [Sphingomonas cavernae]
MRFGLAVAMLMLTGSVPLAAQAPAAPTARVEGNAVAHPGDPALTISVPEGATYVGSERFMLYGVADCEIHLFVEADAGRRVRRFWWVQFEGYLPSRPELRYTYGEKDQRIELWGAPMWESARFGPTNTRPRAGSDGERVRMMLARAGYTRPPNMMNVRLVRLLDDPAGSGYGRRELMLIYAEDMAPAGTTPEELTTDGAPNARWAPLEQALIARAAKSFRVEAR